MPSKASINLALSALQIYVLLVYFTYQIYYRSYVLRNIRFRSFEVNAISVVKFLAKTPARKFHCIQWTKDTERSIIEISFLFEKASFLGYYFFSILCVVPGIRLLHQPL